MKLSFYKAQESILSTISLVEGGFFDTVLQGFERVSPALGIYVPAYVVDGKVAPIPYGYSQSENDLEIEITNKPPANDSVRVSWFGSVENECRSHCSGHCTFHGPNDPDWISRGRVKLSDLNATKRTGTHCPVHLPEQSNHGDIKVDQKQEFVNFTADCKGGHCWYHERGDDIDSMAMRESTATANVQVCSHCHSHCHGHNPPHSETDTMLVDRETSDPLLNANQLEPRSVSEHVHSLCDLKNLARSGIGVALVHGHSARFSFVHLPENMISVIRDSRTYFCKRNEILFQDGFVPNMWRFESGVRQAVAGFLV